MRAEIRMKSFGSGDLYRRCHQCQADMGVLTRAERIATILYYVMYFFLALYLTVYVYLYYKTVHSYEDSRRVLNGTYQLAFQGKVE